MLNERQVREILEIQKEYSEKYNKFNKALQEIGDGYFVLETMNSFYGLLEIVDKELYEWLSYFWFEMQGSPDVRMLTVDDKEYVLNTEDSLVNFLIEEKYITKQ